MTLPHRLPELASPEAVLSPRNLRHALLAVGVVGVLGVPRVATAGGAIGLLLFLRKRRARRAERGRRRLELARALPGAVALLQLAAGAGVTPRAAISLVRPHVPAPTRSLLSTVADRLAAGASLERAVDVTTDLDAARVFDVLRRAERDGADYAPLLADVARDLHRARIARLETDAQRLGVEITFPLVLCILPAFLALSIVPLVIDLLGAVGT